jgi:aromatic-L-amino-acid/L-tryptophan decarboxylase
MTLEDDMHRPTTVTDRPYSAAPATAPTAPAEPRDAPLAMAPDEFRRLGHAMVERIADHLATLRDRPVTSGASPDAIRARLGGDAPLPEVGTSAGPLLEDVAALLAEHSLFNAHPRFFGYITASPAPIGMLGDFLAAAMNPNLGSWILSPVATEIEVQTVRWIAELLGFPRDAGGLLVSGGNMANTVALLAARAARAGWDVRADGMRAADGRRLRVYASAETHTWVQKATDIAGLGTTAVRWIATDDAQRMDLAALRRAMDADEAAGDRPLLVVGTAGSVSTGAVDPLRAIAALCRERGIWFHVDGAYGGFAAALPDASDDLRALALADSVAVDPHKWLYAPLEAGCVLVREAAHLRDAFSYHPPYYNFEREATNFVDLGPQNSRGFRALKVWLALRQVGREGYVRSIGDDVRLSERLAERLRAHPEFEVLTQQLSITTFRWVPPALRAEPGDEAAERRLDELHDALLGRLEHSGEAFVSRAVVGGRVALRACIVNFNTTAADVDAVPEIVARLGRDVESARAR